MQQYKLDLTTRENINKKSRRALLDDGGVLGNIYGRGFDSLAVAGKYRDVYNTVKQAGKSHPIALTIDGKQELDAIVHDIEQDNISQKLHHVTFKVIVKGEKLKTDIPIHFIGEAPADKLGLITVKVLDAIHIETIPSKLPESFDVDISQLAEEGDAIRVSDLVIDEDINVLVELDSMIVRIEAPRAQVEEEEPEPELDEEGNPIVVEGEEGEEGESEEASDDKSSKE